MSEQAPIDLSIVALKCPNCDNADKNQMLVCVPAWVRASDRTLPHEIHGQMVDPIGDALGDSIVECQALVVDDDAGDRLPICRYRGAISDFALYAENVEVAPIIDTELTGQPTPLPSRSEASS